MYHIRPDASIAGMPKRDYTYFSGYVPGRSVASRGESSRTVFNEARSVRTRSGPKRYAYNRFYQGRGTRAGSYAMRRFRGLPRVS